MQQLDQDQGSQGTLCPQCQHPGAIEGVCITMRALTKTKPDDLASCWTGLEASCVPTGEATRGDGYHRDRGSPIQMLEMLGDQGMDLETCVCVCMCLDVRHQGREKIQDQLLDEWPVQGQLLGSAVCTCVCVSGSQYQHPDWSRGFGSLYALVPAQGEAVYQSQVLGTVTVQVQLPGGSTLYIHIHYIRPTNGPSSWVASKLVDVVTVTDS